MSEPTTLIVSRPNQVALVRNAADVLAEIAAFTIDSEAMYEAAAEELRKIVSMKKDWDEQRKLTVKPLNDEVKAINDIYREPVSTLEQAEAGIKSKMGRWITQENERKRREQEEREAKARAERERIAREADERRRQAEAEAAELAQKAAEAAEAGNETAAQELQQQAEMVAVAGHSEAEVMQATAAVTIVVPEAQAKVSGVSAGDVWVPEVFDLRAFLRSIADDEYLDLESLVELKKSGLNALAKQYKAKLGDKYKGIRAGTSVRIGARRI